MKIFYANRCNLFDISPIGVVNCIYRRNYGKKLFGKNNHGDFSDRVRGNIVSFFNDRRSARHCNNDPRRHVRLSDRPLCSQRAILSVFACGNRFECVGTAKTAGRAHIRFNHGDHIDRRGVRSFLGRSDLPLDPRVFSVSRPFVRRTDPDRRFPRGVPRLQCKIPPRDARANTEHGCRRRAGADDSSRGFRASGGRLSLLSSARAVHAVFRLYLEIRMDLQGHTVSECENEIQPRYDRYSASRYIRSLLHGLLDVQGGSGNRRTATNRKIPNRCDLSYALFYFPRRPAPSDAMGAQQIFGTRTRQKGDARNGHRFGHDRRGLEAL